MINTEDIKKLIAEGEIEKALNQMKTGLESTASPLRKEILVLSSELKQWNRKNRLGLQPNESTLRRIDLGLLELIDEIETTTSSKRKVRKTNFTLETRQLEVIIDIHKKSIKRTFIFAFLIIIFGLSILCGTHLFKIIEGEIVKTILTLASSLIIVISGFSFKDINDNYGSVKIFTYFKDYFQTLMQNEEIFHQESEEEIKRVKELVWEATKKTALN